VAPRGCDPRSIPGPPAAGREAGAESRLKTQRSRHPSCAAARQAHASRLPVERVVRLHLIQPPALLGHLIRPLQERRRDDEPDVLRGLDVDYQLELGGLLDGKVTGLGAFEDLIHLGGGTPYLVVKVHRIRHETAHLDELPMAPHRRYPMLGREIHEGSFVLKSQNTRSPEKRVGTPPGHRDKGAVELPRLWHLTRLQC
jgi:hypothetical protein